MKEYILLFIPFFLLAPCLFAQDLSGFVKDSNNQPIIGATVQIKALDAGTITNENGYFELNNLQKGAFNLIINSVGYDTYQQTIILPAIPNLEFKLKESINLLAEVNIISTWAGEKTPITYKNLDKNALDKNNFGEDLPYLLNQTPSVVINSDAGAGVGYTGIRIRGTDPTRINITINGIPINDAEAQAMYWVDIPDIASSTQNIQIQRGVGTSTNGAGAFGGTINLNTAIVNPKPSLSLANTIGSFNTLKNTLQFSSGKLGKNLTVDGRLSRIVSDGYIDRAWSNLWSYYGSVAYVEAKRSLRFNAFGGHEKTYQAWNGVPAQYINDKILRKYNPSGTEKSGTPYEREIDDYTQNHYQLHYDRVLSTTWNMDFALHYTKGFGFYEQYKAQGLLADYGIQSSSEKADLVRQLWLNNDFYGTVFGFKYKSLEDKLETVIGGGYNIYKGNHFGKVVKVIDAQTSSDLSKHFYDNNAKKTDANIYSKTHYQVSTALNVFLDLQFRNILYQTNGLNIAQRDATRKVSYQFFNPKFGFYYDLNKQNKLYASFAVANREPNRDDIVDNKKDAFPIPENLKDTELGYKLLSKKLDFNANLYFMDYKNQLALTGQINGVGAVTRINVPKSYRAGLELDASYRFLPSWQWNANATFSKNKIKEFDEYIDNWETGGQGKITHQNTDLSFSPNIIMGTELQWTALKKEKQILNLALLGKYVGKQYIDNTSNENTKLEAYFTSNVRINYTILGNHLKGLEINLLINNILNKLYSANAWAYRFSSPSYNPVPNDPYAVSEGNNRYSLIGYFPQAGTNFLLGVNFKF